MQRREFLTRVGLAGGALALGRFDAVQAADTSGYKSLVCVFLLGGNDAFNMVVPRSAAEYRVYAAARQNLAVPASALLPITPLTSDGAQYGLHPAMRELQTLFQSGRAAIVANVGPLVQPATKAEIAARSVPLPPQLFSHNDQQDQWQSLRGLANFTTGWAGRVADALEAQLAGQRVPLNISLAGTLPWQAATRASGYAVGDQGPVTYLTLESAVPGGIARRRAFEALVASRQPTPYGRALNRAHERALALASLTQQALTRAPRLATTFPDTPLGRQLAMVARLISVRDELAMRRQIFLVAIGGFDTHDAQNELQPGLLGGVSAALASFDAALRELQVENAVTTFTMSEFSRTLTSNGDGTDHGWGGHQLVIGGAVRGGDIYGAMPRLEINGPDDMGGGRIIPTRSVQQFAATLLKWFGLNDAELDSVVTGLQRFATRDLGFMRTA